MKVSKKETQLTASDRLPYEKFLQKGAESLSDAVQDLIPDRTPRRRFGIVRRSRWQSRCSPCRSVPEADFWDFPAYLATSCSRSGESAK